jgi:UDP-glucuronate decarboxylase
MKRVLITGGAGFLGSNLCKFLLDRDYDVVCLDNLSTGSKKNIIEFEHLKNFTFVEGDVTNVLDYDIDFIYNLACPASPPKYQIDPLNTLKTCYMGILNCLNLAHSKNAKLLHASTSEIYGDPLIHPQSESYWGNVNTIGERSCYDEGKRISETLIYEFYQKYKVDAKIARIFNTYGPKMDSEDGRVVSNFINQALTGNDITIYGDGSQTRSFCYVDDLIRGLYDLMQSNVDATFPINLGNPHEFTIKELANTVKLKISSKSKIVYKNLPSDDPKVRCPNISRANNFLKWNPKVELIEGLDNTIDFFSNEVKIQS